MLLVHGCEIEGREVSKDVLCLRARAGAHVNWTSDRIGVVVSGLGVVQVVRVAGWLGAPEMYTPTHTCTPRTHTYIHHLSGEDLSMVRLEPP